jgi:hypothetical protein
MSAKELIYFENFHFGKNEEYSQQRFFIKKKGIF